MVVWPLAARDLFAFIGFPLQIAACFSWEDPALGGEVFVGAGCTASKAI